MSETSRDIAAIRSYHGHIYYDPETRRTAERIRAEIAARFSVTLGRWHDNPVGPHPRAMFQLAFEPALFATLVPWLMLNRSGLTVLIHPNTDRPRDDHLRHAAWLGQVLALNGDSLPETQ